MKVVLPAVRNPLPISQCGAMHRTRHSRDDYSSRFMWEPRLGAIPCGPRRSGVDGTGLGNLSLQAPWTVMVVCGRCLEIHGSGGWVFESPRARKGKPSGVRAFDRGGSPTF